MKKLLKLCLMTSLLTTLSACQTLDDKDKDSGPLTFPTLEPCTAELLQSNQSFICVKEQTGPDLIETNIKFDADSYTLNTQAKEVLDKLFAYLKLTDTTNFTIKGYAGKVESKILTDQKILTDYNIRLSKNRASSVEEYLVNKGLGSSDGITIKALGYQDPIAPNDSTSSRAINQRVEITLKSRLIEQIDNIENNLEHVRPAEYTKFFSNVYLLNDNQIDNISRIYNSREKRPILGINFKIFANKEYTAAKDNSNFIIISEPKPISSFNDDKKVYRLGSAKYDYTFKGITALTITNLSREASVGNYVIPNDIVSQQLPEQTFKMKSKITANVLEDVMNTNTFSSSYNSILLNKGAADGLKVGAQVILYEPETRVDGFPVPPKYIGYGFIYRESQHYSIALIVNSLQEITNNSMATTIL
ncbi:OmpA family protein [Francisella tularensis]|uniref:OmpA family protein n=8 Tax=Gammaproteobacteria TaxID=1236 RepID=A0AAI8BHE5_FRATH|nr:OmpA family protein [Francisella tularensis]ACD30452.1 OmpA family protein [Francisella tularensis subsp. mediasiatica FSC147]AFX70041.1 OmpA family protein [Francisella tularensis subsp. holarctica F92]AHH45875.1 membrane protein [Francisella tularensis subsp. holarctica PHIT-FT049]EBA52040.1 outer membrane protein ompA [Francisella tularensis subsp. holarctica 257]ABI82331.1 possible OmpA family protein [Francisella tularensis subsp. holarctica OSU18]